MAGWGAEDLFVTGKADYVVHSFALALRTTLHLHPEKHYRVVAGFSAVCTHHAHTCEKHELPIVYL